MEENKTFWEKMSDRLNNTHTVRIIVACGILGIVCILFSSFFSDSKAKKKEDTESNPQEVSYVSLTRYENELRQNLAEIICSIQGAGSTKVMLTMESTVEQVYATDKSVTQKDSNNTRQTDTADNKDLSTQSTYITVELSDGTQQTVLVKEIQPKVRGVLVVCEGGDNEIVKEKVTDAVTKMLDISSSKVSVAPLAK
ncbi:MAG: hypothetical protein IJU14_07325 [Clostridia bacterium]|nr:hypothetical protein [Clostridia bacterium]